MRDFPPPFTKSEFARNVLTLVSGATIAQAIPVAIAPILTRLYRPEDFGIFALFASVSGILAVGAAGRYEAAILLPESQREARHVTLLALLVSLLSGALTLMLVIGFNRPLATLLGDPAIAPWLYLVPLSVLLSGIYQALNYWFNRHKQYPALAASKIYQTGSASAGQLLLGIAGSGSAGLILGWVLGQGAAAASLAGRTGKTELFRGEDISIGEIKTQARRYRQFPQFALFGSLVNSLSYNLANILISILFSASILGFYALVYRVLAMPSTLIGHAVAQVYFQQGTEEKRRDGRVAATFRSTLKRLLLAGIPIFLLLFIGIRYLFAPVFGAEWEEAGGYAQILLPFFFIRFISATLSTTMTILEKLKQALVVHLSIIAGNLLAFGAAYRFQWDFERFLYLYVMILSFLYTIFLIYYYRLARGEKKD